MSWTLIICGFFLFTCSAIVCLSRSFLVVGGTWELSGLLLCSSSSSSSLVLLDVALIKPNQKITQHRKPSKGLFRFFLKDKIWCNKHLWTALKFHDQKSHLCSWGRMLLTRSCQRRGCGWPLHLCAGPCILTGCLLLGGLNKSCGLSAGWLTYGGLSVHQRGAGGVDWSSCTHQSCSTTLCS